MAPRSLRKTLLGCKPGKRLGEDVYLKEAEKRFTNYKFSKINALRKGRSGVSLKFSQTAGNAKAISAKISYY